MTISRRDYEELQRENEDLHMKYEGMSECNAELVAMLEEIIFKVEEDDDHKLFHKMNKLIRENSE